MSFATSIRAHGLARPLAKSCVSARLQHRLNRLRHTSPRRRHLFRSRFRALLRLLPFSVRLQLAHRLPPPQPLR
jgi:hypothetical protein